MSAPGCVTAQVMQPSSSVLPDFGSGPASVISQSLIAAPSVSCCVVIVIPSSRLATEAYLPTVVRQVGADNMTGNVVSVE